MHLNSDNIQFTSYSEVNEVVNELFKSLPSKYQENLETSMKGSNFIFDSVQLIYYKSHKVNFKRGGSYIFSPEWIKKKKATINLRNEDDKFYKHAATTALNFKEIESHPERVLHIMQFINKYNWEGINYLPQEKKIGDWRTFEKNNPTIASNILLLIHYNKEKEILPAYIAKHNLTCDEQIIFIV